MESVMGMFRQDSDGTFVPFQQTPQDLERNLEDWIENNPHVLLDGEDLAIIGRQSRSEYGKFLDLLAVDRTGATVVIELKRGEAPREVIAQALEYAAWVDSLSEEDLDEIARNYASRRGLSAAHVRDLYVRAFEPDEVEGGETDVQAEVVTFNSRQRIVIVAESFPGEMEQTMRYLRTGLGADIYGVQFGIHKAGEETLLTTTTLVGREPTKASRGTPGRSRSTNNPDDRAAAARTDFMSWAATGIDGWIESLAAKGLSVERKPDWNTLRVGDSEIGGFRHLQRFLHVFLKAPSAATLDDLRRRLGVPSSLREQPQHGGWRFHVQTDDDFKLLQEVVRARLGDR